MGRRDRVGMMEKLSCLLFSLCLALGLAVDQEAWPSYGQERLYYAPERFLRTPGQDLVEAMATKRSRPIQAGQEGKRTEVSADQPADKGTKFFSWAGKRNGMPEYYYWNAPAFYALLMRSAQNGGRDDDAFIVENHKIDSKRDKYEQPKFNSWGGK